jgi:hypothetical protein
MVDMEQTTMLAIIALALALGLMTGVLVVETNIANAVNEHAIKACQKSKGKVPFCIV